jgi:hypothetical protein
MNSFAGNEDRTSEWEKLGLQIVEVPVKNGNIVLPEDIRTKMGKNGEITVRIFIQRLQDDSLEGIVNRNDITEQEILDVVKVQRIVYEVGLKILKTEGSLGGSDFLERVIEYTQVT